MQFTTECVSVLLASLLTPSPGAAWCIFNQGMSALTPSCHQNTLFCSCMEAVTGSITSQAQSQLYYFTCVIVCILSMQLFMHFSDRHSTSCLLCDWGLTIILYISIPMLIARGKPIAANKHRVNLPEKVISPSSCPHLSTNLDIFQHINVKYFLSPFTPQ